MSNDHIRQSGARPPSPSTTGTVRKDTAPRPDDVTPTGETRSPIIWGPDGTPDRVQTVPGRPVRIDTPVTTALTQLVARIFLPATAMVAAATLIKGYTDTGDGFSAGVILALGVLIQFVAFGYQATVDRLPILSYAAPMGYAGILLALFVAFVPVLRGDPIMTHVPKPGEDVIHIGSIELITGVAFDIAVFLLVFGFCVGTMSFLARTATSSSLYGALVARSGDDQRPDDKRMPTLNEIVTPVTKDPVRPDGGTE